MTKEEAKLVHRMLEGKAPHADFDPYAVCRSVKNCSSIQFLAINLWCHPSLNSYDF